MFTAKLGVVLFDKVKHLHQTTMTVLAALLSTELHYNSATEIVMSKLTCSSIHLDTGDITVSFTYCTSKVQNLIKAQPLI